MSIPLHGGRLAEGSSQKAQGLQILAMQWNSTVPETSAPLAVFIRASDNRLVIKLWHAQLRSITDDASSADLVQGFGITTLTGWRTMACLRIS